MPLVGHRADCEADELDAARHRRRPCARRARLESEQVQLARALIDERAAAGSIEGELPRSEGSMRRVRGHGRRRRAPRAIAVVFGRRRRVPRVHHRRAHPRLGYWQRVDVGDARVVRREVDAPAIGARLADVPRRWQADPAQLPPPSPVPEMPRRPPAVALPLRRDRIRGVPPHDHTPVVEHKQMVADSDTGGDGPLGAIGAHAPHANLVVHGLLRASAEQDVLAVR